MSTCIRNGITYKRHWWGENGICQVCGYTSQWKIEQLENERQASQKEQVTPEPQTSSAPEDLTP